MRYNLKDQRGISPIAILLLMALVIAAAVFIGKNNIQKKSDVELKSNVEKKSAVASIDPSSAPNQNSPQPKLTSNPTSTPFNSPTPSPIPTASVKQPVLTANVNLGRAHNDMPGSASGDGVIRLMSLDDYMSDDAKIASLQYDFSLKGLEAEREYSIEICSIEEGGDCAGLTDIKTDGAGNANYNGTSGITLMKNRPFKAIKVTQRNGGFCSNSGSPCLRGELSLGIEF